MFENAKKIVSLDNPIRLLYHLVRAIIANFWYRFPSSKMIIIGVTGTNGKTTTTNIIAKGLRSTGKKVFMFSTINYFIGDKEYRNDTKMTSPDVFFLQKLLKQAQQEGCKIAVIETSSHSILMSRNWGLEYDIAVLTNITQDHLDLHGNIDNYVRTKLKLFKNLIGFQRKPLIKKTAIINIESNYKDLFLAETYDVLITYGLDYESNLKPLNIKNDIDYTSLSIKIPGNTLNIKTHLRGKHNIYNILGAIGVFLSLNMKPKDIEKSILDIKGVPGRLEEIKNNKGFKIFIDYAHTPDALEQVLNTIREIKGINRIITVFGATGDRDKTKRPIMGSIVSKLSDYVILTQDDDYTELPQQIIKDVLLGIEKKEGEDFWIIINREDAIRTALLVARENDVVLIAGKGDEHILMTNDGIVDYNDKEVVEKILIKIDDNKIINY